MKITTRLDIVQISSDEVVITELIKQLAKLPVSDLVTYLKGPVLLANKDHATVLKNVMKDEVWKYKLVSRVAEKGLAHDFYSRLEFFEDSPVSVLQNLFVKMVKIQPEILDEYLEDMWLFALQVITGKEVELTNLYKKATAAKPSKVVLKELFPEINVIFGDEPSMLDGVAVKSFNDTAQKAATIKELREIAEKNDILLPTNLTKQDIINGVLAALPKVVKAKELSSVSASVSEMTVAQLKEFVAQHKLDVPTELLKNDICELLVKNYVAKAKGKTAVVKFVLPERVITRADDGDENPKIARLQEKISALEKELEAKKAEVHEPVVVEKVVEKVVEDTVKIKEEQEKNKKLESDLKRAETKLNEKPKEVKVEVPVPGPTVVRTVVNASALQRQKDKYETIITEHEKERALLISRVDEHDQVLADCFQAKKELEAKLVEAREPVIVEKLVEDTAKIKEEQEKNKRLESKLILLEAKLNEKPKEVIVEVPVPETTVVRTFVNASALQRQKDKYEAIIAEQEKERSLLVSRIDEHDEILANYAKVKRELEEKLQDIARQEVIKQEANRLEVEQKEAAKQEVVLPVAVKEESNQTVHSLSEKIERLTDKMHELQLELARKDNHVNPPVASSEDRETEVNIFFGRQLADKIINAKEATGELPVTNKKRKKAKKAKRSGLRKFFKVLFILIIIAVLLIFSGWLIVYYNGSGGVPGFDVVSGPSWLANILNPVLNTFYTITENLFSWVRQVWSQLMNLLDNN